MTRILLISDSPYSGPGGAEAEICHVAPVGSRGDPGSPACWPLADLAVLAAGQRAEHDGFDAVCLADATDFGAAALRSVLSIPVVPAGRSAMLYALTLGDRFALISRENVAFRMKKQMRELGLSGQCSGLLTVAGDAPLAHLNEAAGPEPDAFVLAGPFSADERADLHRALARPVIDPAALSVQLCLGFLGLGLAHSKNSYPAPQLARPGMIAVLAAAAQGG
ncbi:aspartate/glutamate racemase family protein [Paracoccus sp. (in: a-proteobacteria)]|uniref:aspartate/glutamate racemase family protein n=1 Tax=Paracoccus sp. TaxID=267 RepID=UPI003A8682F6